MQRRNFLMGLGAVGIGAASSIGTGAFTNATIPDRQVTANISADDQSQIALVPGSDPDASISTNPGELQLDLSGTSSEGTNINSTYTWGDPNDPSNDYLFKLVNNDTQSYGMGMEFHFDDISWVDERQGQSFIQFELFDADGFGPTSRTYPDQRGSYNRDYTLTGPGSYGGGLPAAENRLLNPGEEWYFVVTVDTTGPFADVADDLSGKATFYLSDVDIDERGWNDGW